MATLTEISNVFNLMCQIETRIESYHFGWRSDINRNIYNNFDPKASKGRMFPALHFDVPDGLTGKEEPAYLGTKEDIEILLYFDALQDYNNDGTANTLNLIEQWDDLKVIANDFMANFVQVIGAEKYNIGNISDPKYIQRSNMHNQRLLTWEVSFIFTSSVPCTETQYKIDLSLLPAAIEETDIERGASVVDTCLVLLSSLSEAEKNTCILPDYDFSNATVQSNVTAEQQADLTAWLCVSSPIVQSSMIYNGVNNSIECYNDASFDFTNTSPFTIESWVKPVDYTVTTGILAKRQQSGQFSGYSLFTIGGKIRVIIRGTTLANNITIETVNAQTNNVWAHVIVKVDGSSTASGIEIWVNDTNQALSTISDTLTTTTATGTSLFIGAGVGGFFDGKIGYTRLWNKVLSTAEVTTMYNGGGMLNDPIGLVNLVFSNRSGVNALNGANWLFPDESGTIENPYSPVGINTTYASRSQIDVPT